MSKEAIKNLLMDFMADYDPNKWSNDDVYEKYAEKIDNVRSMGEIIAFTELTKKVKNLEQQLAEKEKEYKFKLKEMDNEYKKEFKTFEEDCKHLYKTETKKAIEELEKVKEYMEKKLVEFDNTEMRVIMGLYAFNIENQINQQIKSLKGDADVH